MPKAPRLIPGDWYRFKNPTPDQPKYEFMATWYEITDKGYVAVVFEPTDFKLKYPLEELELCAKANPIRTRPERKLI